MKPIFKKLFFPYGLPISKRVRLGSIPYDSWDPPMTEAAFDAARTPKNLTSATATANFWESKASRRNGDAPLLTLTESAGLTLTGATGYVYINITAANTITLGYGTGYFELDVEISGEDEKRFVAGDWEVG
ncbi:hypothetical protein N9X87_00095 [bacterium]|nr:hypothetical protein [bacterium]